MSRDFTPNAFLKTPDVSPARLNIQTQNGPISFCAWVSPDITSDITVLSKYQGSFGIILRITPDNAPGPGFFTINTGSGGQEAGFGTAIPTGGVWTHVGGAWNGSSTMRVMRNGVQDGTDSMTAQSTNQANDWHIGVRPSSTNWYNGRIAEVAMWDAYLSDAEWAALGKGCCPLLIRNGNLKGYWPLWGVADPEIELTSGIPGCQMSVFNPVLANHAPVGPLPSYMAA